MKGYFLYLGLGKEDLRYEDLHENMAKLISFFEERSKMKPFVSLFRVFFDDHARQIFLRVFVSRLTAELKEKELSQFWEETIGQEVECRVTIEREAEQSISKRIA